VTFTEANAVEEFVLDRMVQLGWAYEHGPSLPRSTADAFLEPVLRDALIRLNADIAAQPERADEVIYRLRGLMVGVTGASLVSANEEFTEWLRGERTMPFGPNGEHVTINLVEWSPERLSANTFTVANQVIYTGGPEKRFDLVAYVNGLPLVVGEAKTPVRPAVSWVDGAIQVRDDYERNAPGMFVANAFSFATEGKTYRYGAVRTPLEFWAPWRDGNQELSGLAGGGGGGGGWGWGRGAPPGGGPPPPRHFTVFSTDRKHRKNKIVARYQQYQGANQLVRRVVDGQVRKGLIWHFQGSGKSLLQLFAAQKLRLHPELGNPTVLIVVDRIDLDTQITATFNAADVANTVTAGSRDELEELLSRDARKIIITTIHKFAEADGVLNDRANLIALVDEAHRTQEGDLGRKMRDALPNAFLFGLTGTPINTRDRNTFYAFGAPEDAGGYLDRYSFEQSIRDGATLPLRFEARLVDLRIDRDALDEEFARLTADLSVDDRAEMSRRAGRFALLVKAPQRIEAVARDIAEHFQARVAPEGFGAQVVTIDQEACVLYKQALDQHLPPEISDVSISVGQGASDEMRRYQRSRDEEEKLLDRFRDPADPLKILIVTAKHLTGFDATNLQCMYLDKSIADHNLLQAICRTNRPAPNKTHGLIVDYLGVFDDVAKALAFDEQTIQRVVTNIDELKDELAPAIEACLAYFPGVDRTADGWEALAAAQQCVPDNESRDAFALAFQQLTQLWEAISPDPVLSRYEDDYRWLAQVYQSLKPPSGNGKLLWHALGAKTIELIHKHVQVQSVRDDLETLVMDSDVIGELLNDPEGPTADEVEIRIAARLRKHINDPTFIALSERLENLRARHEQGLLASIDFLKELLTLARDVVEAEKEVPEEAQEDQAKAALTELFENARNGETPIIVERVVEDIDDIVRKVRFPGWQTTTQGEREVQKALRRTLLKYKLHNDHDLFDRAYGYIVQYY
jgi:type I restriction enzyme R subunit